MASFQSRGFCSTRTILSGWHSASNGAITHFYRRDNYPSEYANLGRAASVYAISVSGSLKDNIERIMKRYHWRVVWAPYDYNFDGKVTGSSLPNVIQKLLQPFPLQAVMYMSNRTVAIVPRQIR